MAVQKVLALEPGIVAWAQSFADKRHALFLGRGHHYPIALEGALKLKEISYIHAEADSAVEAEEGVHILRLPEHYGLLSPVLHVVAMQLLAYHVALVKGTDVDKPRNLAKSVTVG